MLKLNLLPASYLTRGGIKVAALAVLAIWLVLLVGLFTLGASSAKSAMDSKDLAEQQKPNLDQIDKLNSEIQVYKNKFAAIQPQADFLKLVKDEPQQMSEVMRVVAHATVPGVIITKYTISPGNPTLQFNAIAVDLNTFNRWRLALIKDPDFDGMPSISGFEINRGQRAGGGGGAPGAPTASGRTKMGAMGAGAMGGGMGGPGAGGAGGNSNYYVPTALYPNYSPILVKATLVASKVPDYPRYPPPAAGGAAAGGVSAGGMAAGGTGGMGGGYPGGGGGMGGMGGGYPGGGGGAGMSTGGAPAGGYPGGAGAKGGM